MSVKVHVEELGTIILYAQLVVVLARSPTKYQSQDIDWQIKESKPVTL